MDYVITSVVDTESLSKQMDYNMRDSAMAAQVWIRQRTKWRAEALCRVFCCHIWDSIRYNTGTMTSYLMARVALGMSIALDRESARRWISMGV